LHGKEDSAIPIAASLVALALAAYASARFAGGSGGLVRVVAQALAVILFSLTGALIGFFIPLIPVAALHSSAFAAGILGTLGTIGGMSLAEKIMIRLDKAR
jgi:hypothetical protein